jgi:hypothetical protein
LLVSRESFDRPATIGVPDWGAFAETLPQHCDVHMSFEDLAVENLHRRENFSLPVRVVDKASHVVVSSRPTA